MQKAVLIFVIVVAAVGGYALYNKGGNAPASTANQKMATSTPSTKATGPVKEFSTTAYYDETGVWYSLKEIRVKQGDTVRIKATNIKGMHDFTIDEYDIKQDLPLNQETTIEFKADKPGQFVFYCSHPGHREKGQWGTLIVE